MSDIVNDGQTLEPVSYVTIKENIDLLNRGMKSVTELTDLCSGTESITGFFKDVSAYFTKGLSQMAEGFSGFLSNPFSSNSPLPQFKDISSYKNKAAKIMTSSKSGEIYSKAYGVDVPYIAGCKVSIDKVIKLLTSVDSNYEEIIRDGLSEINTIVSNGIGNPDVRSSNRPFKLSPRLQEMAKLKDSLKGINAELIGVDDYKDFRQVGEILPSTTVLNSVITDLSTLERTVNGKLLTQIDEEVRIISLKSKSLADDIKNNEIKCSKPFINHLKDALILGGETVTYLATYFYFVAQVVQSFKALITAIEKVK